MMRKSFPKKFLLCLFGILSLKMSVQPAAVNDSLSKPLTVYVFLSETCPICQSYTVKLRELYQVYHAQNVQFVGVFPNYYSTPEDIGDFRKKYKVPFELIKDEGGMLTGQLKATVTPEVFVTGGAGETLYSGRIDDSFYKIGRRRSVVSSNDLQEALRAVLAGMPVSQPKTQAVGCMISLSK